jgi:hypothetical protein
LLERHLARQALQPAPARSKADARLRQRELRPVGRNDEIAGQRNLEAATHGDTIHGGDDGLVEVVTEGQAAEAFGRRNGAFAGAGA